MERLSLSNIIENDVINLDGKIVQECLLDLSKISSGKITINFVGNSCDLLLVPFENKDIIINQSTNSNLRLAFIAKDNINNFKISAFLSENSSISVYFADFSIGKANVNVLLNLDGEHARANWHLASLSSNQDNKEFVVSINHNAPLTYGRSDNYGVCKDDAKLTFSGTSKIFNKSIKSKTYQNAKIMVFDRLSNAVAKPILKIDENDIEASHAAVVGKINDEHLFYLTSRGISEKQSKELITYGYLKPILVGFNDEQDKEEITNLIEGRM